MRIAEMKINNKLIDEAKLNGEIVYRLDRDRTPPEILYVKIQLYNPLIYPNNKLYPSDNLFPRIKRNPNYAKIGDTIYINFKVSEKLREEPKIKINELEFNTNLIDSTNNIYEAYVLLTENMNLQNWEKIEITITNLVDIMGNTSNELKTTGDNNYYVILSVDIPYNLENIIYNSDLRYGISGFENFDNSLILRNEDKNLLFMKINSNMEEEYKNCYFSCKLNKNLIVGHKYYIKAMYANYNQPFINSACVIGIDNNINEINQLEFGINKFNLCSNIIQVIKTGKLIFGINGYYSALNAIFIIKEMMCVDVTELINSGMTETEIKTLLDNTYFPDLN